MCTDIVAIFYGEILEVSREIEANSWPEMNTAKDLSLAVPRATHRCCSAIICWCSLNRISCLQRRTLYILNRFFLDSLCVPRKKWWTVLLKPTIFHAPDIYYTRYLGQIHFQQETEIKKWCIVFQTSSCKIELIIANDTLSCTYWQFK